jgi:all-trans-8'-apo-beta-carotenal 15,15'-oxygenase
MITRRQAIMTLAAGTAVAGAAVGAAVGIAEYDRDADIEPLGADAWLALLGRSLRTEHDYRPRVMGRLPGDLRGTLYRNGPGLFERAGYRKRHLLDGDGMIQAFDFTDAGVRYRNRFVRTRKFVEEESAGSYQYPTWSTRAPGGMFANIGIPKFRSQAGVATLVKHGRLLAFGETNLPYALDAASLETTGQFEIAGMPGGINYKAHTKTDARTGDWILLGSSFGREPRLHVVVRGSDGRLRSHTAHTLERSVYLHDFFATERHVIVLLHPLEFSPFGLLTGLESFIGSLSWRPERGNNLLVFDRNGGAAPAVIEAPARFMWHAVNAFETGNEIIADFVGYTAPDHFIGHNPALEAIMNGAKGTSDSLGEVRRYVIDPASRTVHEEILSDGNYEFPIVNPAHVCTRHRIAYFARSGGRGWYHDGVAALDVMSGKEETFSFGPKHRVGEPIFAARPGHSYQVPTGREPGWLLAEVLDGAAGTTFLAIFDARAIAAGPIAKIELKHPVPISFHGYWQAA